MNFKSLNNIPFSALPIACLLVFTFQLNAYAQTDFSFEQYSTYEGLSHNSAQCILQDQQGFLWFGTEDGLNRFDGYDFKVFRPSLDSTSITGIFIWDMKQDKEGNLWIGMNYGGVNKYDPILDKFISYKHSEDDTTTISSNFVRSVLVDDNDDVWVGTYGGGLNLLNKETGKFRRFKNNPNNPRSIQNNVIGSMFQDTKGRLWIGTEGGLQLFNKSDSSFTLYAHDINDKYSISNNQIDAIIEDARGTLWIGTPEGLNKFDEKNNRFIRYKADESQADALSNNLITSMYLDKNGLIWIGTDGGGITLFNPYTIHFKKIMHDVTNPNSLSMNLVRDVFEDNLGIVWVATNGGGICKHITTAPKFNHIKYNTHQPNGLNHNIIRSFSKDSTNRLWVGTVGGGINIYDPALDSFFYMVHDGNEKNSISSDAVISLLCESDLVCWVGTWQGGLNKITFKDPVPLGQDPNKYILKVDQYLHDPYNANSLSSDIVQALFRDSNGFIWAGTGSGIDVYDKETNNFINIGNRPDDSTSLGDNRVQSAIMQDKNEDIWIGTWNGLYRMNYPEHLKKNKSLSQFNPEEVTFQSFLNSDNNNSISDNRVISVYEDSTTPNLVIWAGTYGGGLNKIEFFRDVNDKEAYKINTYTENDGLPSAVIYSIQSDDKGNLWMSTNNGISMFNPTTEVFQNYNVSEGVQDTQFYWGSGYKDKQGFIYLGGVNGYNVFHPDSIDSQSIPPKVFITGFRLYNEVLKAGQIKDGEILLKKSVSYTDEIVLSYSKKVVGFDFATLHFIAPLLNNHAYILEGIDKDWNYIGTRRFVTYANLPPGEYLFRVKGANNEGVWSEQEAQLKLIVKPPFYKTLVFRALVLLLIIAVVILIYKIRMRGIERKNRSLEVMVQRKTNDLQLEIEQRIVIEETLRNSEIQLTELNASKDKFFNIIAHDLRNPINVMLGLSELLSINYNNYSNENKEKFINAIYQSTTNINDLLNNLLQWSLSQTGRMEANPTAINLSESIKTNLTLLNENFELKDISTTMELDLNTTVLFDKDMFNTIVRNILTNAIKFTPKDGKINIKSHMVVKDYVDLCFTDSGIGMTQEQLNKLFKIEAFNSSPGTDGEKGTGLGLLLCKEFIVNNKGTIWVESQQNRGTQIHIRLPLGG